MSLLLALALAGAQPAMDAAGRIDALGKAAALLEQRYVDPAKGRTVAKALRQAGPALAREADPQAFARAVTAWLRKASGDGHLGLSYSAEPIAEGGAEAFSAEEMNLYYGPQLNHGVEKIERLPGNIMLLDLRVFPPPEMAGDVIAAAMTLVAQGDALIIDLRRNGGGAETAELLMSYLTEPGSAFSGMYNRPAGTHRASVAAAWVPGRRFGAKKPVYILTSPKTFSAAEAVAYDLQALKRATIVGERTGGGAHPFEYRRVHPHFALDLPEGRSENPITHGNWQDVGVQPDVAVPADQALGKAIELARAAIRPADG